MRDLNKFHFKCAVLIFYHICFCLALPSHWQGLAEEGAKVARATAHLPSSTEVAPPKEIYIYI